MLICVALVCLLARLCRFVTDAFLSLLFQVQRVVEFAKSVPGFLDFCQDDQLILIKLGFYEVWLNYIAKTICDSSVSNATLTFDDGAFLTRQQLEIMFDVSLRDLWDGKVQENFREIQRTLIVGSCPPNLSQKMKRRGK
jgi:hypothetical protein